MRTLMAAPVRRAWLAAFSLVELLVATSVAMLMLTLLLTVFSGTLESWSTAAARSETFGEARASLHLLERELNNAAPKIEREGLEIPRVITGLQSPGGATDEALGFFCKVPHQGQPADSAHSDICGVTYFLASVSASQTNAPHALFRRLIPSEETFEKLAGEPQDFFVDACVVDSLAEVVAQNVIGFQVRLRDAQLGPVAPPTGVTSSTDAAYVEVTLKVISSRVAQSYFDPVTSAAQKEKIALQEAREFTLRHVLQ